MLRAPDRFDMVTVSVDGKQMIMAKVLLAYYSEYFDIAFNGHFAEAVHKEIEIKGFSFEALEAYVGWIYSGQIDSKYYLPCNEIRELDYMAILTHIVWNNDIL